jgi:sacsin
VKFLYDGRSFGKKHLVTEHLQKYQGPALYAFNDAIFKPEDWDGIQNLMRSNKKSDILKVGRFGVGFNSVYHITGLCYYYYTS